MQVMLQLQQWKQSVSFVSTLCLSMAASGCGGAEPLPTSTAAPTPTAADAATAATHEDSTATAAQAPAAAAAPAEPQAPLPAPDTWAGLHKLRNDQVLEWAAVGAGAPPFGTPRHTKLGEVAGMCSDKLASAQWRQDTLKQFDATAHFDNCTFEPSIAYVNELLADVDRLAGKPNPSNDDVMKAMELLGRALHSIQDFYSHTNYVELMDARKATFDELLVLPVWTKDGAKKVLDLARTGGLVSGRVWWGAPKQCAGTVKTHAQMAKDDEDTPAGQAVLPNWKLTGYRAAYQLAGWATIQFLREMYAKWPALPSVCGKIVHYLPPADQRSDPR